VPLLLEHYPLHRWTDNTRKPPSEHWAVRIPIIPTLAGDQPAPHAQAQEWNLDTGFSGEAFGWRHHLEAAGLDPDVEQGDPLSLRWSTTGSRILFPVREADLWLVSNVPGVPPFCLPLDGGIAFRDQRVRTPDPEFHKALVGMRILRRVRFSIMIDCDASTVSISVP
jgi:hypothetical protein